MAPPPPSLDTLDPSTYTFTEPKASNNQQGQVLAWIDVSPDVKQSVEFTVRGTLKWALPTRQFDGSDFPEHVTARKLEIVLDEAQHAVASAIDARIGQQFITHDKAFHKAGGKKAYKKKPDAVILDNVVSNVKEVEGYKPTYKVKVQVPGPRGPGTPVKVKTTEGHRTGSLVDDLVQGVAVVVNAKLGAAWMMSNGMRGVTVKAMAIMVKPGTGEAEPEFLLGNGEVVKAAPAKKARVDDGDDANNNNGDAADNGAYGPEGPWGIEAGQQNV